MLQRWQHTCAGTVRGYLLCCKSGKTVCGKCAGRFAVFKRWQKRVREMCGEICCVPKMAKTRVRELCGEICCVLRWQHTCAGNVRGDLLCSKGGKNVCGKCAGNSAVLQRWQKTCAGNVRGILLCSKVAKHVCGKCAGIFGVFKGWQTNECWTCADHEDLHTVAILAQDACCCIWLAPDGRHWLRAKFAAVCLSWCQRRSGRQRRSGG